MALNRNQFPDDFLWGCSTSSYQIEGAVSADGRGASIWDEFCAQPGRIRDGSSGNIACDHYHRWPEDLDLAKNLGINSYRFSVAWPRIFPEGSGKIEPRGLDFYDRLVDGILERGMRPWLTLYHWDLPQALQQTGGWKSRSTVDAFVDYADVVSRRLGDRVKQWITHNEPWCSSILGYADGVHAPGEKNLKSALQACHHVLLSHGLATAVLRQNVADAHVGIALSLHPVTPYSAQANDIAAGIRHDGIRNRWFLDQLYGRGHPQDIWNLLGDLVPEIQPGDMQHIAAATDFLGVNYYFPETVKADPTNLPLLATVCEPVDGGHGDPVEYTDFGWQVAPQGLIDLLRRIQSDYDPAHIYITENGSAYHDHPNSNGDIDDVKRQYYLQRHIAAALVALKSGVNLRGYFCWSLMDNFEWAEGYFRRFGLTYVDFESQRRILKFSGKWYGHFLRAQQRN